MNAPAIPDYYAVLGVARTVTTDEIKWAYRKIVQKWHPDRCKAPGASDRLVAARRAYELLSDAETRRSIDVLLAVKERSVEPRLPHPDEVDRRTMRGNVLTTHGWLARE